MKKTRARTKPRTSGKAHETHALKTAEYFADRRGRADSRAVDRIMGRKRGEKPREGDEA